MKYLMYFSLSLCFFVQGCSAPKENGVNTIDATEAKAMMDREEVIVVDVRTEEEYAEGHLPSARNLPLDEINKANALLDKDAKVIVYCRSGARSAQAAQLLSEAGFTSVYDMGGIIDWPYEVVQ